MAFLFIVSLLTVLSGCGYSEDEYSDAKDDAYQQGYQSGVDSGYSSGYDDGYAEAFQKTKAFIFDRMTEEEFQAWLTRNRKEIEERGFDYEW